MTPKKELKFSIILALVLFVISVVAYAFQPKEPENPVRMMFKCVAGKVLFTHKNHFADSGLKISCDSCHHHEEEENNIRACGVCHTAEIGTNVPKICLDCHEPDENHHPGGDKVAYACKDCHMSANSENKYNACTDCHETEDIEGQEKAMMFEKRSDAFHKQCIDCHKSKKAGPVECNSCHVI